MGDLWTEFEEMFSVALRDEALDDKTVKVLALMTALVFADNDEAFDVIGYMKVSVLGL
jgi:hypothetical protein